MAPKPIPLRPRAPQGGVWPVFVPVTLLATAVVLGFGPWGFHSPVAPATVVASWVTDSATIRQPTLRPELTTAGFTYRCSDCHRSISSPPETTRTLTQHKDIVLQHGINTRCFNCHHRTNRDAFVDDWGREIAYDASQLVCAKCHGPVYRDWLHGAHGRTNGYWDGAVGPQERHKCVDCHDPHRPSFPPLPPAPPPDTLRMGRPPKPTHEGPSDPLRVYRQRLEGAHRGNGDKPH